MLKRHTGATSNSDMLQIASIVYRLWLANDVASSKPYSLRRTLIKERIVSREFSSAERARMEEAGCSHTGGQNNDPSNNSTPVKALTIVSSAM